jgi:hypothetical protein
MGKREFWPILTCFCGVKRTLTGENILDIVRKNPLELAYYAERPFERLSCGGIYYNR